MAKVVGIDLAGSDKRKTGFCAMDDRMRCSTSVLYTDQEILEQTLAVCPRVASIDAPLFLPKGRESIEKKGPHISGSATGNSSGCASGSSQYPLDQCACLPRGA